MDPPSHTIDPDGEVIIILHNANNPIAQPELSSKEKRKDKKRKNRKRKSGTTIAVSDDHPAEEPVAEGDIAGLPVHGPFRIQVSAKHLMLASAVFKKLLTGGWKESTTFLQKGSVEVTAESWDIQALMIVLRAIHGQHYQIPRKLTLEMLAKVAIIADYYDCKEPLDFLTDVWITNLEETIPTMPSRDLTLWIWIAWFFRLPSQYTLSTSIAMSQSYFSIDLLGLPVPANVIGAMNIRREKAINDLIYLLHATRDAFLKAKRGCCFECRSMMRGALTMEMRSCNLISPTPKAPFANMSYNSLAQRVQAFASRAWYGPTSDISHYGNITHGCSDASFIMLFRTSKDPVQGLELFGFTISGDSGGTD